MAQLLSNLPVGAKIKFGKHSVGSEAPQSIVWVVVAKNHTGYPTNSAVLATDKIIDLRAYDGKEKNKYGGNANFALSNIHQWLNSSASAGAWYNATHANDAPPSSDNVLYGEEYQSRPGFLYNFTDAEKKELVPTTLTIQVGEDVSTKLTTKVFLPTLTEAIGSTVVYDGTSRFKHFDSTVHGVATLTPQAYNNTKSNKPNYVTNAWPYWTRTTDVEGLSYEVVCTASTEYNRWDTEANNSSIGVRPLVVLSYSARVSDTTDSDGAYSLIPNVAPAAPTNVRATTSPIYTTKPCTFSWDAAIDPDGDSLTYKVHIYYDEVEVANSDGSYGINVGTATSFTIPAVKSGIKSVTFGVEAIDPRGEISEVASIDVTARTNGVPTISGSNSNIGTKSEVFSHTYTVSDADGEAVTVTEYIDDVKVRSYVATLNETNTFSVTGNTWLKLANGIHTLKITATDGIDTSTRTLTFTKEVNTLVVQRATPIASGTKPTRLVVTVVKSIPSKATLKVEACNNGFDTNPVWEDITSSINSGQAHVFSNIAKTSGQWGVNVRVTINRNGGEGACYITEIGGNFE